MSNIVNVRAELKKKYNDPFKNYKDMLYDFKRKLAKAGVIPEYKERSTYESKSDKRRKSQRATKKKLLIESIEGKIKAGDKVDNSCGFVKRVKSNMLKEKAKKVKFKEFDE